MIPAPEPPAALYRQRAMTSPSKRRARTLARIPTWIAAGALLLAGCDTLQPILSTVGVPGQPPAPTCGGLKILLEGALPCADLVDIAIATLAESAPDHLARGVTSIDVVLAECSGGGVPQNLDCLGNSFAQSVTVTFGPAPPGGPVEPSLTVVLAPATGEVLGIINPLVR